MTDHFSQLDRKGTKPSKELTKFLRDVLEAREYKGNGVYCYVPVFMKGWGGGYEQGHRKFLHHILTDGHDTWEVKVRDGSWMEDYDADREYVWRLRWEYEATEWNVYGYEATIEWEKIEESQNINKPATSVKLP